MIENKLNATQKNHSVLPICERPEKFIYLSETSQITVHFSYQPRDYYQQNATNKERRTNFFQ